MAGPIFGNNSSLPGSSGGNRHLVEFRAGRMTMVGKMVHPDTRKGLLYVYQADDGLIHFCWKNRTTNKVEDDLIIFPDDCEFKRVEQCKTGRVYLLKFKSTSARLFFWMQEPKADKDEEWCRRINDVMNNPPSVNSLSSNRSGGNSNSDGNDLSYMLNNMSQQQLLQLFGGVGQMGGLSNILGSINRSSDSSSTPRSGSQGNRTSGSTAASSNSPTTPATSTVASNVPQAPKKTTTASSRRNGQEDESGTTSGTGQKVLLSDLQNFLSGLQSGGEGAAGGSGRNIDLASAINTEALDKITASEGERSRLVAHLPTIESSDNDKKQLKDTIQSPQFRQALSSFSTALQSGQLGPVVSQFQLNSEAIAAANTGDLEQFVKALEKSAGSNAKNAEKKEKSDESKQDNTPMEEDKNA
ncbi:proteasomal ubiquitin receptor ADRM1 homolog [Contarinia nasturtii]|uniref:proteasomal ubiquitin receptor ADRM1 homolog n=1 Tax=Contarinia nasturtii TaxID=265458 RepID=UPI0012D4B07E|nr:proteasomal ubiquitin receptor ADRM1 homolog [Contarinia nasturtii]